jgi:hypothetical protein
MWRVIVLVGMVMGLGCASAPVLEQRDVRDFAVGYNQALDTLSFKGVYAQTPLQSKKVTTEQVGRDLLVKLQVSAMPGLGFND